MLRRSPRTALAWAAATVVAVVTAVTVVSGLASLRHQDEAYGGLERALATVADERGAVAA